MIRAVFVLLVCTLPTLAFADGSPRQEFSFISSFLQMIAALFIVVGLILVTRHFSGKLMGGITAGTTGNKHIRIVETRYIGPKKSLVLIEVGGEYLLLGNTDDRISFLKNVSILEHIEVIENEGTMKESFSKLLRDSLRIQRG